MRPDLRTNIGPATNSRFLGMNRHVRHVKTRGKLNPFQIYLQKGRNNKGYDVCDHRLHVGRNLASESKIMRPELARP